MSKVNQLKSYERTAALETRTRSILQLKKDFDAGSSDNKSFYDLREYYDANTRVIYYPWAFSKTLDHTSDPVHNFPKKADVDKIIQATVDGDISQLDIRHPSASRPLENVVAGLATNLMGTDSSVPNNTNYYAVDSAKGAYEMAEVYSMALLRDTTFLDIENLAPSDVNLQSLNNYNLADITGPTIGGVITGKTLHRGISPDELEGPYISQFLYLPFDYGNIQVEQKYVSELDYRPSVFKNEWVDIQNGIVNGSINPRPAKFVNTPRVLGAKVHNDPLYQFYYNAALIALPLIGTASYQDPNNSAWISGGGPDLLASVAHVALGALKVAWHHKYMVGMKIRPEVYAQRVELAFSNESFVQNVPGLSAIKEFLAPVDDLIKATQAHNAADPLVPAYPNNNPIAGYTLNASSNVTTAWNAFDRNSSTSWNSTGGYDGGDGSFIGVNSFNTVDAGVVSGESVEITFDNIIQVGSIEIEHSFTAQAILLYDNGDGLLRKFADVEPAPFALDKNFYNQDGPVNVKRIIYVSQQVVATTFARCNQLNVYEFAGSKYLLLQFPEGSPTHPSHPAGHATVSGACSTVLKAMLNTHNGLNKINWSDLGLAVVHSVDGDNLVSYPNSTSNMTIVGELNKLASNVALGRDWAGVHYRCDGDCGVALGEEYAISYLVDKAKEYPETYSGEFEGWILEKFDGSLIRITQNGTVPLV